MKLLKTVNARSRRRIHWVLEVIFSLAVRVRENNQ